jgi:hypothetical protein
MDWLVNLSTMNKYVFTANRIDQGSEVNMYVWLGLTYTNDKTMT